MDIVNPPADYVSSPLTKGGKEGILTTSAQLQRGAREKVLTSSAFPLQRGAREKVLTSSACLSPTEGIRKRHSIAVCQFFKILAR